MTIGSYLEDGAEYFEIYGLWENEEEDDEE